MSLIRPVVRWCAVAALRQQTWAEERVYDSDNTPLADALLEKGQKPYITVFTEDDIRAEGSGMDFLSATRRLSLVIEMGVASAIEVRANEGTASVVKLQIPQTDEAMESLLDLLEGQVVSALITNPHSPFGEVFKRICNKIVRAPSMRTGSAEGGTRWAARQLTLIVETINDSPPGIALDAGHPIRTFITLARQPENANLKMVRAADLMEPFINDGTLPDWRQAQAWLGLTELGIKKTGIGPITSDETKPELEEIAVEEDQSLFPVEYPGEASHEVGSGVIPQHLPIGQAE